MDTNTTKIASSRAPALLAALALTVGLALTVALVSFAPRAEAVSFAPRAEADNGPKIVIEDLTGQRHEFTDDVRVQVRAKPEGRRMGVVNLDDASNMAILKITVEPGAVFPWHTHPGPVLVAVVAGELQFIFADDCVRRPYEAGTAFVDLGQDVHLALNDGSEDAVLIATFLGVGDAGPLTIPVSPEEGAALDEKCEIER